MVDDAGVGHLKVSFFGPFYSSYIVFNLDADYRHAFVTSYNRKTLWLLSRSPQIPEDVKQQFVTKAKALGYPTDELIWVKH